MGAFFTNIHFYSDRNNNDELMKEVSDALVRMATNGAYREAKEGEFADRSIIINPTENPHWFVIYDEDADSQDISVLDELGKSVSAVAGISVISVLVHDNDSLRLDFFKNGKKKDARHIKKNIGKKEVKNLDWFGMLREEEIENLGGQPKQPRFMSEEPLEVIADLLNWDKRYCFLGYDDRDKAPETKGIRLRFKLSAENQFLKYVSGPPYLCSKEKIICNSDLINKRTLLMAIVGNKGGENVGISAFVAVENDLPDKIKFYNMSINQHFGLSKNESNFKLTEQQGKQYLMANFDEFYLGPDIEYKDTGMMCPWQTQKVAKAFLKRNFLGAVVVEPLMLGEIEIKIRYVPHQNKIDGAVLFTYRLEVVEELNHDPYDPEI